MPGFIYTGRFNRGRRRRGRRARRGRRGYLNYYSLSGPDFSDRLKELMNVFDYGHVCCSDEEDEEPEEVVVPTPPKPPPVEDEVLSVEKVDFKVAENVVQHHTDEYDITEAERPTPQLVVRRGQPFNIQVVFSRPYKTKQDDLRLIFEIGDDPKPSKGTSVQFILSDKDEEGKWGAKIARQNGATVDITVFTPPDCFVGKWKFKIGVLKKKDKEKPALFRYNHKEPIYMLFNPWCKEDRVYMEKASDLEEYVLREDGRIFVGSYWRNSGKPWVFGQFTDKVLDCCMYLLKLSNMKMEARGDPVRVVRKLTAMVNSSDEGGVLTGNWSGDYSGGTSPLKWTGSAAILEQYLENEAPVRFGQCWVFSGVLTAVLRALGIPARSVTNFASAHDCDGSVTIDYHFNSEGDAMENEDTDSVWNFHVWNEAWMSRPDLPPGYGGWQACDSTPQETSEGVYCCGPCPVRAIKEGNVHLPFDGPFIFAEVNADKAYWQMDECGSWTCFKIEKQSIGKKISSFCSTSSFDYQRDEVTSDYKYPENSPEERVSVRRANQMGSSRSDVYEVAEQDVEFELVVDDENSKVGNDFVASLRFKNTSKQQRCVYANLSSSTMYYTGVVADKLDRQKVDGVQLKPGETKEVTLRVGQSCYQPKLKDCCMLSVSVMAQVVETKQIFVQKECTTLTKPGLNVVAPEYGKVGKEIDVEVSFCNPLDKTLTDCYLLVEGPGLTKAKEYPQGDVQGKGTFLTTLKLKPAKKGKKTIVINFACRQLEDINGTHEIKIKA